jgi:hypothetical protein
VVTVVGGAVVGGGDVVVGGGVVVGGIDVGGLVVGGLVVVVRVGWVFPVVVVVGDVGPGETDVPGCWVPGTLDVVDALSEVVCPLVGRMIFTRAPEPRAATIVAAATVPVTAEAIRRRRSVAALR